MTDDKKKALMVYALGALCVLLAVGAGWAHVSYRNCQGTWSWFVCTPAK